MSSRTRPGQHHTWPDNVQATPFGAPDMFGLGGARTQPAAMAEPVGAVAARVPKGVKGGCWAHVAPLGSSFGRCVVSNVIH